ncbi:hypothetical protein AVEN_143322-1 [Araneus ventricosus]|uniref:Uncharacterized protein n=1 Tax=Araneus ventricosus TaxID=182803 RepID=A0A4Y2AFK1_ARAVE|nr:hypothetical protein AVEN_143322-1 [Araneus ventricosus]
MIWYKTYSGRGGLVVRSRLRGGRIPGSKPDSTENTSCIGPVARKIIYRGPNVLPLVWPGSLERWSHLRCRPRHLTEVYSSEVRHKIPIVCFKAGR